MLLNQAGYAPFGPATGWVYGNGRTLSRSHTRNYQAETIQDNASGGLSLHYGYDAAGQLTELKDGLQSAFLARYDYDNLGRLTILRDGPSSTPIETYTYDATGNRTSLLHGGITTSFTYPGSNHRLSSAGGIARSYDGVGNTTAIGGTAKQFNYGEDDRMNSVSQNGTMLRSYAYNALGERVLSTIPAVAGNPDGSGGTPAVNTYTVYDESGRWLGDYDHNGAVLQQAIWLDDLPVGLLAGTGANQKLHYIEPDHLGTPRAVIDRSRDVAIWTWALQGEAFGNSAPNQDPDLDSTNFVLDMRFPGQRYDAATGLNYNYFRDYDAGSGRYVQSDPIGLEAGVGTFIYTGNSPLKFIDVNGLMTVEAYHRGGVMDPMAWEFRLEFNPLSAEKIPGYGGKVRKAVNWLESMIDASKPDSVGPKRPARDHLECAFLDAKLLKDYEDMKFRRRNISYSEALRYLNYVYLKYSQMRKLYDLPNVMLDNAISEGRSNWFNFRREMLHGPAGKY